VAAKITVEQLLATLLVASGLAACAKVAAPSAQTAHAEPQAHPDFTGIWSGWVTTDDNLYWQVEDIPCFPGCPASFHAELAGLLDDSANAQKSTNDLIGIAMASMIADRMARSTPEGLERIKASETVDLATYCEPYGFVREALNALPISIRTTKEGFTIDYEEWSLSRTIYMDGRAHPKDLALQPLGHSIGHYEGDTLVVDTVGLKGDYYASIVSPTIRWGSYADGATAVERYTIKENPRRLVAELTLIDPVTLKEPYVWTKTWLATPDVALVKDSCKDVPGQPTAQPEKL
jgi:hypothetical protein